MKTRGWMAAAWITVLAVGGTAWAQTAPPPTIPKPGAQPLKPQVPLPPATECRDPKAMGLKFSVVAKDAKWPTTRGTIRVTGTVKNVGNAAFESDPKQASVQLLEERPGARAELRTQRSMGRLDVGATMDVTYQRAWDTAAEFPSKFILLIVYDPDIQLDANKKNDDCNAGNNRAELPGDLINRGWPK